MQNRAPVREGWSSREFTGFLLDRRIFENGAPVREGSPWHLLAPPGSSWLFLAPPGLLLGSSWLLLALPSIKISSAFCLHSAASWPARPLLGEASGGPRRAPGLPDPYWGEASACQTLIGGSLRRSQEGPGPPRPLLGGASGGPQASPCSSGLAQIRCHGSGCLRVTKKKEKCHWTRRHPSTEKSAEPRRNAAFYGC
jgi:hypothetical protein